MIHWLQAKRASWHWDKTPSRSVLTPEDLQVLSALDSQQARETDLLSPHLPPSLPSEVINLSLTHLVQHGLARRLARGGQIRYKLTRHGAQLRDASPTKR